MSTDKGAGAAGGITAAGIVEAELSTRDLITLAEGKLKEMGFELDGEAVERWEADGVYLVTPKRQGPADDNRHWYLSLAGVDGVDEPGIDLILINSQAAKAMANDGRDHDDQIVLQDWNHLWTILLLEGYMKPFVGEVDVENGIGYRVTSKLIPT